YFESGAKLWAQRGLHAAQEMAESLQAGQTVFTHLDAAQLLKHCLGLSHSARKWTLTYLWYDVGGDEGSAHRSEVSRFTGAVKADGAGVAALTYQDFFARLAPTLPDDAAG